jgi:phosphoribosylformylglycinamidine cyclo-ligase
LIGELAGLQAAELRSIFNCGVGMALVVEPSGAAVAIDWLAGQGIDAWRIGEVVAAADAAASRYVETAP